MSQSPASNDAKRAAARAALLEIPTRGVLGLGSGTTARIFLEELGAWLREGNGARTVLGVPTSEAARRDAVAAGIPLAGDDGPWEIDVTIDGADEVSADLDLIKGGGGAHTREKIVNAASRRNVIIVTADKLSKKLGETWPIPIEVVRYGHAQTAHHLSAFGEPKQRMVNGAPFVTDSGNCIYDVRSAPIEDPKALDSRLRAIPGVVETGLFVGRADVVLVADLATGAVVRKVRGA